MSFTLPPVSQTAWWTDYVHNIIAFAVQCVSPSIMNMVSDASERIQIVLEQSIRVYNMENPKANLVITSPAKNNNWMIMKNQYAFIELCFDGANRLGVQITWLVRCYRWYTVTESELPKIITWVLVEARSRIEKNRME
jgi:hypothetical protein